MTASRAGFVASRPKEAMSRRRALLAALLLSAAPIAPWAPAIAQTPAPADQGTRPITPAPTYGAQAGSSYQPPASRQPAATGRRLEVPPLGGAAGQSTGGGQSATGWQTTKRGFEAEQQREQLRRLDENTLAGGQPNLAGGDYGVDPQEPQPLAGGDYGLPVNRPALTVTIAPSVLGDPLAAAPRGFRNSRLPRLRRLPDPSTLTAPGQVDPDDPYAPLGVRAGAFLIRPSIETAIGYDDNPDRLPKNGRTNTGTGTGTGTGGGSKPKGSAYSRLRSELDVQSDWERHALDFRGAAEVRKDFQIKDSGYEPQVNAALSGRVDVTERTQINTELRGSVAAARPGDPDTPTGIKGEEITRNAGATLGVAQRFNRLSLRLDGLVDRFTVDDTKNQDGTKNNNDYRAYNQYEVRLRGAYEVSPKLEPFAEIALDTRDYDLRRAPGDPTDPGRKLGSSGWAARGGARFELTRLVSGEASLGYGKQTQKDPNFKAAEGLLIDGAVAWAPTALTTVRFTATSALQESSDLATAGVLSRNFVASVEHRLRRNWSVTARAGYERSEYKGSNPRARYDTTTIGLDTEYRLNRSLALTGSLERVHQDSSLRNDDYTASIIEFGLKFRR